MDGVDNDDDFDDIAAMIANWELNGFRPLPESDSESAGLPPRKRPIERRDFYTAYLRFERFYFCKYPVYLEADFERRFRIRRVLFDRIERAISGRGEFREGLRDATSKPGIHP